MSTESQKSAYAVIPAYILFNTELSDGDKILYGHISNLCNMHGFCWASNRYLSELTGKSIDTVKRAIKALKDGLFIEIEHELNGEQDQRKIYLSKIDFARSGGGAEMNYRRSKDARPGGAEMHHIISKEEKAKENIQIPPPPKPPPQEKAPPSSAGGGGLLSSSLVGDWTYRNMKGEAVSISQTRIFQHFVKLSFTTEILQEAIKQAMESNELIGDPWRYLEAICFRLTQENKPKLSKDKYSSKKEEDFPVQDLGPSITWDEAQRRYDEKYKKRTKDEL